MVAVSYLLNHIFILCSYLCFFGFVVCVLGFSGMCAWFQWYVCLVSVVCVLGFSDIPFKLLLPAVLKDLKQVLKFVEAQKKEMSHRKCIYENYIVFESSS